MRGGVRRVAAAGLVAVAVAFGIGLPAGVPPASAAPAAQPAPSPAGTGANAPSAAPGPSVPSGPQVAPGVATGPDQLRLLGQSTDVTAGGSWRIHLAIGASAPAAEQVRLEIYPRLTTRTAFRQSLSGRLSGDVWQSGALALSALPADPGGGVTLSVPVDAATVDPQLPNLEVDRSQSALYPVQVDLLDGHGGTARTLTTYLLYSAGGPAKTDFPKLKVSLSLDLGAAPPVPASTALLPTTSAADLQAAAGQLPPSVVSSLSAEVAALARHPDVPLSVGVTPQTADALVALEHAPQSGQSAQPSASTSEAASTVSALSSLVAGGDELLPSTWVDTSLSDLSAAGLTNEIAAQFSTATSSLRADLHQAPATDTWVLDRPLDASTLAILEAHGAKQLVVPSADLSALPGSLQTFTVAAPAELSAGSGPLAVEAADRQLSEHFSNSSDQVLAAQQLLAELAMIQLETPSRVRGVAVMPPAGWTASPAFLDTLLAGLHDNPLLEGVTTRQLFATVPAISAHTTVRRLAPTPAPTPLRDAATIGLARTVVQGYSAVLPNTTPITDEMARRILLSESTQLSVAARSDVLGPVVAAATPLDKGISLPPTTSITLTARKGNLPLTILVTPASLRPHVELRLSSDKLSFEHFSPPDGYCTVATPSAESCELSITSALTTVKVPVEARTSGVFTLNVSLASPEGSLVFAAGRDTVRSTAVSGVGVILIVLAGIGLAYWWFRAIRHGRRARRLVDVYEEHAGDRVVEEDLGKGAPVGDEVSGGRTLVGVPDDAGGEGAEGAVSPSRGSEGPT